MVDVMLSYIRLASSLTRRLEFYIEERKDKETETSFSSELLRCRRNEVVKGVSTVEEIVGDGKQGSWKTTAASVISSGSLLTCCTKSKVGSTAMELEKTKNNVVASEHVDEKGTQPVISQNLEVASLDLEQPKKEIWKLRVMLDDLWIVNSGESELSMEMLIRDIKGDTIQATVMTDEIENWKLKLKEGQTYFMRNFRVGSNDLAYEMSPHKYRNIVHYLKGRRT
ncbi:hypothetical protein TSUD_300750 [Trifolium subterraneum]|uniref:Replication protein A 70 kDa DNA-binding subunit B/D first OB fold domain-containing protein n=1 Tax=Trifolium subterraneum TaxID=3900 RepID=A0A2Z6NEV7_TRISU|nr:hypothetical protein TSUD_300750 [Trifolium subterraneum]